MGTGAYEYNYILFEDACMHAPAIFITTTTTLYQCPRAIWACRASLRARSYGARVPDRTVYANEWVLKMFMRAKESDFFRFILGLFYAFIYRTV